MPIPVQCPTCQGKFKAPDHYAGRQVKCPQCLGLIVVPGEPAARKPVVPRSRPASKPHREIEIGADAAAPPERPPAPESLLPGTSAPAAPAAYPSEADNPKPNIPELAASAPESTSAPDVEPPPQAAPVFTPVPDGAPPAAQGDLPEIAPPPPADTTPALAAALPNVWYLRAEEAEYGPVTRDELDRWKAEGRIDASCQLLAEGWEQWQWAASVYPELAAGPVVAPPASGSTDFPRAAETQADPAPAFPVLEARASEVVAKPGPIQWEGVSGGPPTESTGAGPSSQPKTEALSPAALRALAETRPWVSLLAILGLVCGALGALACGVAGVLSLLAGSLWAGVGALAAAVGPALLLTASVYLRAYGLRIGECVRSDGRRSLEAALIAQRSFWRLAGMVVLATVGLYVLLGGLGVAMTMFGE